MEAKGKTLSERHCRLESLYATKNRIFRTREQAKDWNLVNGYDDSSIHEIVGLVFK